MFKEAELCLWLEENGKKTVGNRSQEKLQAVVTACGPFQVWAIYLFTTSYFKLNASYQQKVFNTMKNYRN